MRRYGRIFIYDFLFRLTASNDLLCRMSHLQFTIYVRFRYLVILDFKNFKFGTIFALYIV